MFLVENMYVGHNLAPRGRRGTRMVGNDSYNPPELTEPSRNLGRNSKPMFYFENINTQLDKILMIAARNSIPGVWRSPTGVVCCVEFVFEVEYGQVLHSQAKI